MLHALYLFVLLPLLYKLVHLLYVPLLLDKLLAPQPQLIFPFDLLLHTIHLVLQLQFLPALLLQLLLIFVELVVD